LPKISLKTRFISLLLQVLERRGGRCGREAWRYLGDRPKFMKIVNSFYSRRMIDLNFLIWSLIEV
jgi:hypothetical protein